MFGINAVCNFSSKVVSSTYNSAKSVVSTVAQHVFHNTPPLSRRQRQRQHRAQAKAAAAAAKAPAPVVAPAAPTNQRIHTLAQGIVFPAKVYSSAVETAFTIGANTASCASVAGNALITAYTLGILGTGTAIIKSCFGYNDIVKAGKTFPHKPDRYLENGLRRVDERTFAQRVGEATGNVFVGMSKCMLSTAVTATYIKGAINNTVATISSVLPSLNFNETGSNTTTVTTEGLMTTLTSFNGMAGAFTTGINSFISFSASTGLTVGLKTAELTGRAALTICQNPTTTINFGLTGGAAYLASKEIVAASNSTSYLAMTGHVAGAALTAFAAYACFTTIQ